MAPGMFVRAQLDTLGLIVKLHHVMYWNVLMEEQKTYRVQIVCVTVQLVSVVSLAK